MTSLREMRFDDLFKFNSLVFDALTEVYSLTFFVEHLLEFPGLSQIAVAPGPEGRRMGYIFGKKENLSKKWGSQGHISALTVSAEYRRLGVATALMNYFYKALDLRGASCINLFMRCTNLVAYHLYCSLGYVHQRTVLDYYPEPENAFEMRKYIRRPMEVQAPTAIR
ncbi:N-alpha-acetyltransferase 20 [Drosophila serrata]|uniref:N-alpha-acetyltransferase 20 n=1 Tax=Drosophila serrata TaxID=7274 RepID=UPI000A1D3941|nr:N-alpha-acetyltransferase 20 [Drosophila serrata]KAH8381195.1 hypothetical protein KR200_008785 [Drosophila serrata]